MNNNFQVLKKEISAELKKIFPQQKFSLTKHNHDCLYISWTDGVNDILVDEVVKKYEGKQFCGMRDLESYSNYRGIGYVFTKRTISEEFSQNIFNKYLKGKLFSRVVIPESYKDFLELKFDQEMRNNYGFSPSNWLYRIIRKEVQ
jgi:hypothetical protein